MARLKTILDAASFPVAVSSDWLCWIPSSSSQFSITSVYNRSSDLVVSVVPSFIWSNSSPPKSQSFG